MDEGIKDDITYRNLLLFVTCLLWEFLIGDGRRGCAITALKIAPANALAYSSDIDVIRESA